MNNEEMFTFIEVGIKIGLVFYILENIRRLHNKVNKIIEENKLLRKESGLGETCPACGEKGDIFSVELTHCKCRKCGQKWSN